MPDLDPLFFTQSTKNSFYFCNDCAVFMLLQIGHAVYVETWHLCTNEKQQSLEYHLIISMETPCWPSHNGIYFTELLNGAFLLTFCWTLLFYTSMVKHILILHPFLIELLLGSFLQCSKFSMQFMWMTLQTFLLWTLCGVGQYHDYDIEMWCCTGVMVMSRGVLTLHWLKGYDLPEALLCLIPHTIELSQVIIWSHCNTLSCCSPHPHPIWCLS